MLKSFLKNAFAGSASRMVLHAIDDGAVSAEDLDEIANMIKEAKQRKGDGKQ
jgi:predicted transcriptional regulator